MNKQNIKNSKGITLVALIITIVVLLILAVVAIGTVKNSNIIGYAQNAAEGYSKEKGIENDTIKKYEEEIEKYIPKENLKQPEDIQQTAKAFMLSADGGFVGVISPDCSEFLILGDETLLPMTKGVALENTDSLLANNIKITIEEGIDYKQIYYLELMNAVFVVKSDETGVYAGVGVSEDDGNTIINVTTGMFWEFDDSLLSNYYNDSTEVEYYSILIDGYEGVYVVDYSKQNIKLYIANGGSVQNLFDINYSIISNNDNNTITIKVGGQPVTITDKAKKITYNIDSLEIRDKNIYIQNDELYLYYKASNDENNHGIINGREIDRAGKLTKFVNIGLISSAEQNK